MVDTGQVPQMRLAPLHEDWTEHLAAISQSIVVKLEMSNG